MASKLRRTPLFGYDGNLGIPLIPPASSAQASSANRVSNGQQQSKSKYDFDNQNRHHAKVSSSGSGSPYSNSSRSDRVIMEVGTRNSLNKASGTSAQSSSTPGTPNKHVNFGGSGGSEEKKREKFLTAKYGAHQMALIRKRLRVEMWMYERLQEIYGADDIEIDLDEVLDMEDESERRAYISELLTAGCKRPLKIEHVNLFVGDLLEKVKTL